MDRRSVRRTQLSHFVTNSGRAIASPHDRYSDLPLNYAVIFCGDHSDLPANITFQDNLLHILLSH